MNIHHEIVNLRTIFLLVRPHDDETEGLSNFLSSTRFVLSYTYSLIYSGRPLKIDCLLNQFNTEDYTSLQFLEPCT